MAANPIVTVRDDGKIDLPADLRKDPRFQKGASLELVPQIVSAKQTTDAEAWRAFRDLRGLFADEPGDVNASLEAEKQEELFGWQFSG
jgi:hypothetical protein